VNEPENTANKHVDEITLLLYVERQLDRDAAQEVSLHTQTCVRCLTLLRALDRESRLLTRSMLEQDEPLPARLAEFHARVKKSMQWIWGVVFGLAVLGVYALYTGYIEPWQQQFEQAGFGSTNLLSLLVFQGAFWKGWQSMFTLVEFVALASAAGFALFAVRRYLKRGTALAVLFASLGVLACFAAPSSATEFRKAESVQIRKDESIKGDLFVTSQNVRVEGTVDGDVYVAGKQVEVSGHVTGDVLCACQSLRISGQVDGNVRNASNNLTITGSVGRNVSSFTETLTIDSTGKIGRSLTTFTKSLDLDGALGGDLLGFVATSTVGGSVGGDLRIKGDSLSVVSGASIAGKAMFEGDKPADVASGAKLSSPIEFKRQEHHHEMERGLGYYIWRVIWTGTFIVFGMVLLALLPLFGRESVESAEHYGASFGLGVLVLFAVPIAAIIVCFTVIGLFLGLSTLALWVVMMMAAEVVVGTIVGQWVMGHASEYWPLVLRMAVGIILVRIVTTIPFLGGWAKFAVSLWGLGAISLALYRRLQPVVAPNIPSVPMGPGVAPLPPNTTVGGI
jgi:cytoskeletal protein CcmA (bactofilin family)